MTTLDKSDSKNHSTTTRLLDIVIPVHNDSHYLSNLLTSIFKQHLPPGWAFHVHVVDDGSQQPVHLDIPERYREAVSLIRLERNKGCSVARNRGAAAGSGEVILFLDADCSLAHEDVLALLLKQYVSGFDVCFGQMHASKADFWARYQNDLARKRALKFLRGEQSIMTTIIFMVKRKHFESAGGFDETYHFGFEDRDLFLTLIKSGARFGLEPKAIVYHNDQLSLMSVTKKLYRSGAMSSAQFIKKHPEDYIKMPYSKADARYSNGGLMILAYFSKPILWPLVRITDWIIDRDLLPYFFLKKLVKYLSGLAYLQGTNVSKSAES